MIKKLFLSLVLTVVSLLVFAGCTKTYKVTFKQDNGQQDIVKEVKRGQKVEKPTDPTKEGFTFEFWTENGKEFDFETKIVKNHVLFASWKEQTTGLKVVLPEYLKVTTPNVDLNNLSKGTKLDFEITVPTYHLVAKVYANTSDITNKLKEGNKFAFTINKNMTFKVLFEVKPEVNNEVQEQLGKVENLVIKKLESEPELTLEQVKEKIAEKLDLTLVDLEVVKKENEDKFVVTLTSKKVDTLKVEKEITVTYEKLDVLTVTITQSFTLLTAGVDLNAVQQGTELEFQVVVPSGKVIDTLTANGKDIKSTLTAQNTFKITIDENQTLEVTFKVDENAVNQEVEAELAKLDNQKFDLVDDEQEKTLEELKALLEAKVNLEVVNLQLVKNATDYTVTLISKKLDTVVKTKNITVTYDKYYSVTVPTEITVEGGQDLTKVPANTKLTFNIALEPTQVVQTLKANENDILSTLVGGNKFEYIVDKKVTFTVTFGLNQAAVEQEVETELGKIQDNQAVDAIDADELSVEDLTVELKKLVNTELVEVEVVKNAADYTVTLTSKKLNTVVKTKNITVTYNLYYSVTVPAEITALGGTNLAKVQKGTEVEFQVTVPAGKTIKTLTANDESIIEKLDAELKFKVTINKQTTIAVTFAEITIEHVVRDNEVTLTSVKGDAELLVLPAEVEGLPVRKIAREFLKDNKKFKKVIFPASLKEIGIAAFEDSAVTDVVLNEGLKTIDQYAFYRSSLKNVTVPATVTEVGFNAFSKSRDLEDIIFNNPSFELHIRMFYETKFLEKSKTTDGLYVINNVLLGADRQFNRNLVIPANIIKIARNAFDINTHIETLASVDFSQATQLVEIGDAAFLKQEALQNLQFPSSLKVIGSAAFMDNESLRTIKFNDGLEEIKSGAFYGAKELTKVELPDTITVLHRNVFGKARKLANITANGIKEIKDGALRGTAFTRNQLSANKYAVLSGVLYASDVDSATELVVPAEVKVIAEYAFSLTKFTSITIPNTVEKIEKHAIYQTLTPVISVGGFIKDVEEEALFITRKTGVRLVITDVNQKPEAWAENFYNSVIGDNLTVLWAPEVTINYDLQGGNPNGGTFDSYVINKNNKATRPTTNPTKDNFVFGGWLVKGQQFIFEETPVVETITLVANWIAKSEDFAFEFNEEYGFTLVESLKKDATTVEIPSTYANITVNRIAENAFVGSTALTSVVIPNTVKSIGEKAFYNVTTLANITIPETLKLFGAEAFIGTAWLTQKRNDAVDKVVVVNEVLIDAIEATGDITVSDVTKVNSKAFKGSQVTKVTFNEGLVEIAREAFAEAAELTEVVVPETIEVIGKNAFANTKVGFVLNAESILYELDGFEEGYDADGRGGKIIVNFDPTAEFISITVNKPEAIVPQNPKLKLNKIFKTEDEPIQLLVKTPKYHVIKTLLVNGEEMKDQVNEDGLFELIPNKDYNIVVEFEVIEEVKQAVEAEKEKLGTKLGISEVDNYDLATSIPGILNTFVNNEVVEIQYVSNDATKVVVKVVSKQVPSYSVQVELEYHVYFDLNKDLKVDDKSGQANFNESAEKLIDDSLTTKWCDVGSGRHFVTVKFDSPRLISKFTLVHAGEQENAGFITRDYDIYVSNDDLTWKKVVEVRNNKTNRVTHLIQTIEATYIRLEVLAGEQGSIGNSTVRIYDFRVYGKDTRVPITVQLNGGNFNGKTDDVIMYPNKFQMLTVDDFKVFKKEYHVFDKVVDANTNQDIDLTKTKFETERTIKIIWKIDPVLVAQMDTELNKIYDPFVVETTNPVPTEEEIRQELAKKMNLENFDLVLESLGGNKYKVILQLKVNSEIKTFKEITVLPRMANETKQLTLNLNGGKLGENTTTIVLTVLKGEKATRPEGFPTKENYEFLGWVLNGNLYDFDKVVVEDLTIEAIYSPNKENTKAFKDEVNKIALNQGLDDITTLDLEAVRQHLTNKVNAEVVNLNVELVSGTEYKVTITSVKCPELVKELKVKYEKNITITVPKGVKVNGETGNVTLIKGVTYRLEVEVSDSYETKKILLAGVDITNQLYENSYYFTAEEGITIEFEKILNSLLIAHEASELETKVNGIPSVLKISSKASVITKEVVENFFKNDEYSNYDVEATLIEGNQFEVKLTNKEYPMLKKSKVVVAKNVLVTEGVSVHESTSPSKEEGNLDRAHLLDYTADGKLNLETIWTTITNKPQVVLELQEAKKIDTVHISFAKLLDKKGQGFNEYYPFEYEIHAGATLETMHLAYKRVKSGWFDYGDKDVVAEFTDQYLADHPEPVKYIKIKIIGYNNHYFNHVRIEGIELFQGFTSKTPVLTVDLNGGTSEGKEVLYQTYNLNSQLTGLTGLTPTRPNFTFTGFETKDGTAVTDATQITKDMTIYAKWEREASASQNKFNITINLNGGKVNNNGENIVLEVYENEKVVLNSLPKVEKEDFAFEAFVTTEGLPFDFNQPITQDSQLKAKFYAEEEKNQYDTNKQLLRLANTLLPDNDTLAKVKDALENDLDDEKFELEVVEVVNNERYVEYKVTVSLKNDTSIKASKMVRVYKITNITKYARISVDENTNRLLTGIENLTDTNGDGSQNLTTEFKFAQNEEKPTKINHIYFDFDKVILKKVRVYLQNPEGEKHDALNHTSFYFHTEYGFQHVHEIPQGNVTSDYIEFNLNDNDLGQRLRLTIKDQNGKLVRIHGIEIFGVAY